MASSLCLDLTTSRSRCSTYTQNNSYITSQMLILVHPSLSFVCTLTQFLTDWVNSVALSADGRFIVSGSKDKSIKVFDMDTKQQLYHFLDAHSGIISLSLLYVYSLPNRANYLSGNTHRWQVYCVWILRQVDQGIRHAHKRTAASLFRRPFQYHLYLSLVYRLTS